MRKQDLPFRSPYLNAAGMLGFTPNPRGAVDISKLGGFFTNPVSLAPRAHADQRASIPFAGGLLLHSGLPNPGLSAVLKRYAARWADASLPVIVHLLANAPGEVERMVRQLEGLENVAGVEIGLPPGADPALAADMIAAAVGELPVIACLPLEHAETLAVTAQAVGAAALSLAAARGCLPAADGSLVTGRLYGPALLPQTLAATRALAKGGLPVIAAGGIYARADADTLLAAGASAVQLDTVLWKRWGF